MSRFAALALPVTLMACAHDAGVTPGPGSSIDRPATAQTGCFEFGPTGDQVCPERPSGQLVQIVAAYGGNDAGPLGEALAALAVGEFDPITWTAEYLMSR